MRLAFTGVLEGYLWITLLLGSGVSEGVAESWHLFRWGAIRMTLNCALLLAALYVQTVSM